MKKREELNSATNSKQEEHHSKISRIREEIQVEVEENDAELVELKEDADKIMANIQVQQGMVENIMKRHAKLKMRQAKLKEKLSAVDKEAKQSRAVVAAAFKQQREMDLQYVTKSEETMTRSLNEATDAHKDQEAALERMGKTMGTVREEAQEFADASKETDKARFEASERTLRERSDAAAKQMEEERAITRVRTNS